MSQEDLQGEDLKKTRKERVGSSKKGFPKLRKGEVSPKEMAQEPILGGVRNTSVEPELGHLSL
jgi:hypothetical protein